MTASLGNVVKLVFALHLLFAIFAIGPLVHAATTAGRGVRTGNGAATAASARMLKIYSYASVLVIIAACFLPWAYFPDLNKDFTGFFSEKNIYGRPGKVLFFFGFLHLAFFLIPKIWAKRANIFTAALTVAFIVKSYILYTSCYHGICPEKRIGLYLVCLAALIILAACLTPDVRLKEEKK